MSYQDGSSNAPAGTPQMPNLLNGNAERPPWEVAGVDYAVGIPSGTTLKDPSTISMAGVSVNTSSHVVTVTGNNVTLNGYDFSLNGGWEVYVSGASNTVIENSKFLVGSNNLVPIQSNSAASNLTIEYNTMDGGGTTSNGNSNNISALVFYSGSGTFDAEYNSLTNAPEDAIDFNHNTVSPTVEFNLVSNIGTQAGSHPDFVQFVGGAVTNAVVSYNTIYEPATQTHGMEGVQIDAQVGGTVTNTTVTNNTIIAPMGAAQGDTMSYLIAIQNQTGTTGANNIGTVADNYVDPTGAWGGFYPIEGTNYTVSNNVDMTTGKIVEANNSEVAPTTPTTLTTKPTTSTTTPTTLTTKPTTSTMTPTTLTTKPTTSTTTPTTLTTKPTTSTTTPTTPTKSIVKAAATEPTKIIQTDGSTRLTEVANHHYNLDGSSGSDATVKYKGTTVTVGEFGKWTPIGAVQTAGGFDVAWKNTGSGQYTVWSTDRNGNYKGNLTGGDVSGTSYALESLEPVFHQDLNRDGVLGPTQKLIQTDGSTRLTEVANHHYNLDGSSGSDATLKYKGTTVTVGEFGKWTPIGAVQTAGGFDVAWKNTGSGQYTVWSTDRNGNYKGNLTGGDVSGTSYALELLEPVFHQDLNRDGVLGPTQKLIQTDGSTRLTEVANHHYNLDGSSGSDATVKYKGTTVTVGEFGKWTPIGAVQTAGGFDVAWKNTGSGQYTVWSTDRNGNYKGNLTGGDVSGTSYALESLEPVFHQDLNRDGVLGPTQKLIQTDGSTRLTEVANHHYNLDGSSGSDATVKYKGTTVTVGEFGKWTPIGAVQTAGGFDVAWKNTGSGQYTVWSTDRNGNYKGNLTGGDVSGTSYALESLEPVFHQDLNRDGVLGPTQKLISD